MRREQQGQLIDGCLRTAPVFVVKGNGIRYNNNGDRLRCLIELLEGHYPVRGLEFYPELDECGIEQ